MSSNGIRLRVSEARQRDVGKKIGRLTFNIMNKLGVDSGDYVEVVGPSGSSIVQPCLPMTCLTPRLR